MTIKSGLHGVIRRFGFDVVRFDGRKFPERKRAELMQRLAIDLVIDVGADSGGYVDALRTNGFDGRIVAFEPLSGPFERLRALSERDSGVTVHRCALGAEAGDATLHVSGNLYSSSLLPMKEAHLQVAPESAYYADEHVEVRTLDSFELIGPSDSAWLKVDTQGYEAQVLGGSDHALRRVRGVEIELSYLELYEGQALAYDLHEHLRSYGLELAAFGRPLYDPKTSILLQIDAIFLRA